MLKKRVIPILLLKGNRLVKGKNFTNHIDTGNPSTAIRVYSAQDADELIFINIERKTDSFDNLTNLLREAAKECFMPLTVGGGISNLSQIESLIASGADKVILTTAARDSPDLISKAAALFGSQAIVVGLDYKILDNRPCLHSECGSSLSSVDFYKFVSELASLGAGELYLSSISRDGAMSGYDLDTAKSIKDLTQLPIILSGGAGNFMHLADALNLTNVSAVACASLFHFGDNNPIRARSYLRMQGIPMRKLK